MTPMALISKEGCALTHCVGAPTPPQSRAAWPNGLRSHLALSIWNKTVLGARVGQLPAPSSWATAAKAHADSGVTGHGSEVHVKEEFIEFASHSVSPSKIQPQP